MANQLSQPPISFIPYISNRGSPGKRKGGCGIFEIFASGSQAGTTRPESLGDGFLDGQCPLVNCGPAEFTSGPDTLTLTIPITICHHSS